MARGYWKPFTDSEEKKIKNEYLTKPVKRLASEIGTTYGRIMRYLDNNGLQIPRKIIEKRKKKSQIKKGTPSFTKGKRQSEFMSKEAINRTKKTRFKKGHIPHNANPSGNGAIVTRRDSSGKEYKYIRTAIGVWALYHRVVWERANGPIPKNKIVSFIDGDTSNTNIENLKLITRIENMYKNSVHNYPEEIIPSLVLVRELENKLNNLQND